MKKAIITLLIYLESSLAFSQTSKQFELYSLPCYDSLGNQFQAKKSYYHIPTAEDSAAFRISSRVEISQMMDSVYEERRYSKPIRKAKSKKNQ